MQAERRSRRIAASILATAALVVAMVAGSAGAAHAEIPTAVAFDGTGATVAFGADWTIKLAVTSEAGLLDTPAGTLDIFVEGVAGPFASGVPIYFGGEAFVTQPSGSPPLGAGDHRLSAIFRPAAGSGLDSSQTQADYVLSVTPLAIDAHATVVDGSREGGTPILELSTDGAYVDALGAPAGVWTITVVEGSESVLTTTATQDAGTTTPVAVSLAEVARPGREVTIDADFAPDPSVAPGMTVTQAQPFDYEVSGVSPVGFLTGTVTAPWWLVALGAIVLGGIVSWLVVILVRRSRSAKAA